MNNNAQQVAAWLGHKKSDATVMNNAQLALALAAGQKTDDVLALAEQYKTWLDEQDKKAIDAYAQQYERAAVHTSFSDRWPGL